MPLPINVLGGTPVGQGTGVQYCCGSQVVWRLLVHPLFAACESWQHYSSRAQDCDSRKMQCMIWGREVGGTTVYVPQAHNRTARGHGSGLTCIGRAVCEGAGVAEGLGIGAEM